MCVCVRICSYVRRICTHVYDESYAHKLYIERYIYGRFKYFANVHNNNFTDYNNAFASYTYIHGITGNRVSFLYKFIIV